jgi:hypothetical protein
MSLEEVLNGSSNKLFMALALFLIISSAGAVVGGALRYSALAGDLTGV